MISLRLTVSAALLLAFLAGCGRNPPAAPSSQPPLRVGMELAYPPFEMTDTQGEPAGVSPDLARALAKHLGRELEIRNLPFDGLIPSLKTGKIDVILSSMTATEERARSIDFSEPYAATGLAILARADSPVRGIDGVRTPGTVVAVKKATTGHMYAAEHLSAARLLVLDEDAACALEVAQGKADAFLYDQWSVYQHWRKHGARVRPILEPFRKESWAMGIRKGNDALRREINAFLADFRARGGFEELGNRHLGEAKKAFADLGYPFFF